MITAARGFNHVFIIMMENTAFDTLIGNRNAPFINFAAATTGVAINYFGVTHPELSGKSTHGIW